MPPRLAAVVLPVGLAGLVVAAAAAISFAVSPRELATLAGNGELVVPCGVDSTQPLVYSKA